ncbi:hypothetical protein KP509_35G040500 [Ceratopteris richardii]|uniref:30S ribosomal protein S6 n=2 Tax=Ceratopteris richardii TaxID=49495 RepID=A0A8T2QG65_CERRI|nr:hypothetical protein KP509_35G040500 [Ceratopteris richardii]KAH7282624.1 hypothetical protein KP509_35G040500 [Ceratopteris richardii]
MEQSMVMDRSVLSVRPPSVSIGSGSEHRLPGSICSFGLKAQHSSPLRFFQSLRQEDYRAVHRCKVSAEPQRKVKLEEFGLPDEFELPDFFEIDKDVAALELLFESEELLKTARHYEVMFLVHEDHVDQLQYVIQKVKDFIEDKKGKIHRINDWGMRKLAYKIKKSKMANYILMNIQLDARYTDEFKNLLDKDERIIRHLVMTMKRAETVDTIPPPEVSSISDEEYETDDEELEESYYEDDGDDVLQEAKDENLSRL